MSGSLSSTIGSSSSPMPPIWITSSGSTSEIETSSSDSSSTVFSFEMPPIIGFCLCKTGVTGLNLITPESVSEPESEPESPPE